MSEFEEATAVKSVAEGRYEAGVHPGFSIGHVANGGYVLATMLRAVLAEAPHAHPVATSAHFLRGVMEGPAEVTVGWLRSGRTTATARASLVQSGAAAVESLVSVATLDPATRPDYVGQGPPSMPPAEQCLPLVMPDGAKQPLADRMDLRFDPATRGRLAGTSSGELSMRGYFRLRERQDPDAHVLALAVDALPPVVFALGSFGWAPTVELTWHMRAVPAPGWLTMLAEGRLVRDGWFDEEVTVWDSAATLVAQSRQLARVGRD